MAVRFIRQDDIDYSRWDNCISNSLNGNLYALSWYLEIIGSGWAALVEDDYESVMPLIFRRNNLFPEIYSPRLSGQLGVFSGKPVNQAKIQEFLDAIPEKFRRVQIYLNRQNSTTFKTIAEGSLPIFEMDLIAPFSKAQRRFSIHVNENIRKAENKKYWVMKHLPVNEIETYLTGRDPEFDESFKQALIKILVRLVRMNRAEITGVYSPQNTLCAVACYVKSNNNVILLFAHSDSTDKECNVNYMLLNSFLESYSARNVTLSLEYCDKHWNEDFYSNFGAMKTYAYCFCKDRRPFFLRWVN